MEQLALDIEWKRNPLACSHVEYVMSDGHAYCNLRGGVFTNCQTSLAGEPPHCVYEPCDNSPETMARRRAWIEKHETESAE